MRPIPGLDADVAERAKLTDRQAECLELHLRGASYRWIARELGLLNHQTSYGHVQTALAKVERAMRPDEPAKAAAPEASARAGVNPFAS